MKDWPKDGNTADVESLLRPLAKMLRRAHKQKDIDNVLVTAFQYGIEQGKRIDKDTVEAVIIMFECCISIKDKAGSESIIKLLKGGLNCARNLLPDDLRRKSTVKKKP